MRNRKTKTFYIFTNILNKINQSNFVLEKSNDNLSWKEGVVTILINGE
jgi:hypothetical protein